MVVCLVVVVVAADGVRLERRAETSRPERGWSCWRRPLKALRERVFGGTFFRGWWNVLVVGLVMTLEKKKHMGRGTYLSSRRLVC